MALKIENNWNYVGGDRWDWEAFIDDKESGEINDVEYVEYILHPTFENPIRIVNDLKSKFKLETNGWGEFNLKAFVYKKDGRKIKLEHQIKLEYAPQKGSSK